MAICCTMPLSGRAMIMLARGNAGLAAIPCAGPARNSLQQSRSSISAISKPRAKLVVAFAAGEAYGENPTWSEEDFVVVGMGHCFMEDGNGKLKDYFVIEPIAAGAVECMENGGKTCYKHIVGTTLGVVLQKDVRLLPQEFHEAVFGEDFDFRTKCASRNWKREYPIKVVRKLVPDGVVRSDFNFSLEDKRILNKVNVVTDEDNIKQDLSIDVYGRKKDEEAEEKGKSKSTEVADEFSAQISSLYNV